MGLLVTLRTKFRWLLIALIILALVAYLLKRIDGKRLKSKSKKAKKTAWIQHSKTTDTERNFVLFKI